MQADPTYTRSTENAIASADTATRHEAAEILARITTNSVTIGSQTRRMLRHTIRQMGR